MPKGLMDRYTQDEILELLGYLSIARQDGGHH